MTDRPGKAERTPATVCVAVAVGIVAAFGVGAALPALGWLVAAVLLVSVSFTLAAVLRAPRGASDQDSGRARAAESDAMLRLVSDAAPDAVVLFTELGVIRHVNAHARVLFFEGTAPEGQNFLSLVTRAPAALREALLSEADGFFRLDLGGRPETYHVSRRLFEIEHELHVLLVVKHVTREVTRREVEVLKQVVRMVSHEANNSLAPVTSLVHSARLILEGAGKDPRLGRVLDTIEERAVHLRTFLDGYASLARLPKPKPKLASWAEPIGHAKGLYPELRTGSVPERKGWFDPVQLEQVLINLLKNAVEAGSAPSDVELAVVVLGDGTSEVRVLDKGAGFGPEALENALLPLFSTKEKGSGMGLALSREIVEAHGGDILLANRDGGGSEVRLTLPGPRASSSAAGRSLLTLTRH